MTAQSYEAYPAPAKLNLDLRITGRRADGYHELESIFCLIGLSDTVWLRLRDDGRIVLHNPTGVPAEQDLAYRAAAALQPFARGGSGVEIRLDKRIPAGGGLGGGSSDAATVLMVLNRLWQCGLSRADLAALGLKLGADVPFFLFGRHAFARGVGERLAPIDLPFQWYVVVRPPQHVATAAVFGHPDLPRNSTPAARADYWALQPLRNDMQGVVLAQYPAVAQVFRALSAFGEPRLTGSGSCLFLAFDSRQAAAETAEQLTVDGEVWCVPQLAQHPLADFMPDF
ncbi:4-(cytidine 5'-diphospho)-2-C-methyl-D-erythritol kinase [Neisseria leonii]|uniref:4-(cytidine 5'-diphospho)-2-C-methyl-D-erythritol kinase n=1 Tax=Neisseria leonii TaxID=2995413 RepID=UPI00237BE449|nr:4-(cytidine 5'-diphospho)-2-C-methyl-D-erythritol kinase [Neisseria sp. 3986]MDD9324995.1 4-(cytidine 5'-diphospho)-2-C-methyl-D-erythritol kinase [Neisseria sp. 3986]